MTDKAILDVELNTSAFDEFRAKFDAYRAYAAKTPGAWDDIGKAMAGASQALDKLAAHLAKAQGALAVIENKTEDAGNNQIAAGVRWTQIASSAKVFGSNIKESSLSLAKWTGLTGLFAGILSAGGLYGISRMAAGVGGRRSAAMSYGLSYGEYQSYRTNFERLGNSGGLLAGFNEAMTNAESRAPLYALLGPDADKRLAGKSAAGALAEALPDIKHYVDSLNPDNMGNVLHARGLDRLGIDLQTAQTIRRMSPQEVNEVANGFRADVNPLGLPPEMAKQWQDFSTAIGEAGAEIENHFAVNLVNLEPGLKRLAVATADLVDHILKDGGPVEKWLKKADHGIERFAGKVGSRETLDAINTFVKGVSDVSSVIGQIVVHTNPFVIAWGVGGHALKVAGYVFGGDADADTHSWWRRVNPWAADYRTKMEYWKKYGGEKPVDDAAEDAKRWQRYKDQNAKEIEAEKGGKSGSSTPRPAVPEDADRPVVPEDADQSTWGPNDGRVLPASGNFMSPFLRPRGGNRSHAGIDIAGERDSPIISATNGEVIRNQWQHGYGWTVDVLGDDGKVYRYAHLDEQPRVPVGGRLEKGQAFAKMGASGTSNPNAGFHLHHEIRTLSSYKRNPFSRPDAAGNVPEGLLDPGIEYHLGPRWSRVEGGKTGSSEIPLGERTIGALTHPHMQGQTDHVHVHDETGHADVRIDSRSTGPVSSGYDSSFGRFGH